MLHRLGRCVPEDGGRESDCLDGDWQEVREEEEEGREEIGTSESRWPTDCSGCIAEEESPPAPSGGEQNAVLYSSQASPSSASWLGREVAERGRDPGVGELGGAGSSSAASAATAAFAGVGGGGPIAGREFAVPRKPGPSPRKPARDGEGDSAISP